MTARRPPFVDHGTAGELGAFDEDADTLEGIGPRAGIAAASAERISNGGGYRFDGHRESYPEMPPAAPRDMELEREEKLSRERSPEQNLSAAVLAVSERLKLSEMKELRASIGAVATAQKVHARSTQENFEGVKALISTSNEMNTNARDEFERQHKASMEKYQKQMFARTWGRGDIRIVIALVAAGVALLGWMAWMQHTAGIG